MNRVHSKRKGTNANHYPLIHNYYLLTTDH